jgi:hypothetical protein
VNLFTMEAPPNNKGTVTPKCESVYLSSCIAEYMVMILPTGIRRLFVIKAGLFLR